jgi:hypothetical protein
MKTLRTGSTARPMSLGNVKPMATDDRLRLLSS